MITLFSTLLRKAILKIATVNSVYEVDAIAARQHRRSLFMLKVLNASPAQRTYVKMRALESNSPGQKEFADILTIFELLSDEKKRDFTIAFAATSALQGGATPYIALGTAWQQGHIPAQYEP